MYYSHHPQSFYQMHSKLLHCDTSVSKRGKKRGHLLFITFLVVEMRVKIKKKKRKMTKPCTENNGKTQRVFEAKIGK